ncbi:hypothetical protein G9A89_013423 [Geosiphon pyriformis]|nr:hypothetical protein G9A89_013423 [Geosiphon pyriformis]
MKKNSGLRGNGGASLPLSGSIILERLLGEFDPFMGTRFALVTQSVDRHRLRIFDRLSGVVMEEFFSEKEDKYTCLRWGEISSGIETVPSPKKKKKYLAPSNMFQVLALGLQNGSIAIYSLLHGNIYITLGGAHTLSVNDFVFTKNGEKGFSCSEDLMIVEWDINGGHVISKWKADSVCTRSLALSHDERILASAGHTIILWDLESKQLIKKLTGHASLITKILFGSNDNICISTAEHDRFINVWDCRKDSDSNGNITALTLDTNTTRISISSSNTVLAISEEGTLSLFHNFLSPLENSSTPRTKKKKRYTTRSPDSVIKFLSAREGDEENLIPIIAAYIVEDSEKKDNGFVVTARGNTVKPDFEKVQYMNGENHTLLTEVRLIRQPHTGFLIDESELASANLKATHKEYDESQVNILGSTNIGLPKLSLAENKELGINSKLDKDKILELSISHDKDKKITLETSFQSKFTKIDAKSLQNVLIQALHSDDTGVLNKLFLETKHDVIKNTVRKMPPEYVIRLLEKIVIFFQSKTGCNNPLLLEWIKQILLVHTAYLMTVPDLIHKLSNFYQLLNARLQGFDKLLSFHGRLEMVMQQISMRQEYANQRFSNDETTNIPVTVYVDSEEERGSDQRMDDVEYADEQEGDFAEAMSIEEDSDDEDYLPSEESSDEDDSNSQREALEANFDDASSPSSSSSSSS